MNEKNQTEENVRNHSFETSIRIQRQGGGWVAEGPGYYVWDENPSEVVRAAQELQRGNYAVPPTRRMLIVQPQERIVSFAGANTEALDF